MLTLKVPDAVSITLNLSLNNKLMLPLSNKLMSLNKALTQSVTITLELSLGNDLRLFPSYCLDTVPN